MIKYFVYSMLLLASPISSKSDFTTESCKIFSNSEQFENKKVTVSLSVLYDDGAYLLQPLECNSPTKSLPISLSFKQNSNYMKLLYKSRDMSSENIVYGVRSNIEFTIKSSNEGGNKRFYAHFDRVSNPKIVRVDKQYGRMSEDMPKYK